MKKSEIQHPKSATSFTSTDDFIFQLPTELRAKLESLTALTERSDFHPEANTYEHIKIVLGRCISTGNMNLIFAALFHDITKLDDLVETKNGKLMSIGHDKNGAKYSKKYTDLMESYGANSSSVYTICKQHMRIKDINNMRKPKREALKSMSIYDELVTFSKADNMLLPFDENS